MKRLLVILLLLFRLVWKKWKTFITPNPQERLLVCYELDNVRRYALIGDDNENIPLTAPESLRSLRKPYTLSSDKEWLGFFEGDKHSETRMAVIWNPTARESVGIVMPIPTGYERTIVGFGVCPNTNDPKLVKICVNTKSRTWLVDVFTLSKNLRENEFEGAWENVYDGPAFENLIDLECAKVSAKGVIYFRAYDDINLPTTEGSKYDLKRKKRRSNFVISFDLKSLKFDQVCLPEKLVHAPFLSVAKVKESLGLLDYIKSVCNVWTRKDGTNKLFTKVCGLWTRKDGADKPFTKLYPVKVKGMLGRGSVLWFRNNGDVLVELRDDDNKEKSVIEFYKPSSGHHIGVGINGTPFKFSARSYPQTPLLTDRPESDSIIR